jgi:hypothetical protein
MVIATIYTNVVSSLRTAKSHGFYIFQLVRDRITIRMASCTPLYLLLENISATLEKTVTGEQFKGFLKLETR